MAFQSWVIREGTTTVRADGTPRCLSGNQSGLAGLPPSLPLPGCLLRWEYFFLSSLLSGSGFYRDTGEINLTSTGLLLLPITVLQDISQIDSAGLQGVLVTKTQCDILP